MNAHWIGWKAGEDSPFLTETYSREIERNYIGKFFVETGTLLFRREFSLKRKPTKAILRISGLGFYESYVNGTTPDPTRVLTPIISDYFKLVRYDSYDVTALLKEGANTLCAEVSPGWFAGEPKYWGWQQTWYGNPRLTAVLELTHDDGHIEEIMTDESWHISHGSITKCSIYDGEECDFNLEQTGWKLPSFDDSEWSQAVIVRAPAERLEACIAPPERIIRVNEPVKVWPLDENTSGYDFGENGAAMPYVVVRGNKGDTVCLRHAEYLNEDGTLNRESENKAECTDTFILANDQPTVCRVRFTWHGYRYMTVTLSSPMVEILDVRMQIVHSDVKPIGTFSCGKPEFNTLQEGYLRSLLACLQGVPVDCPQRDERKAWLGDAHVVSEMAQYNFDMEALYRSFLEDMNVSRSDDCGCVSFLCPCYNIEATVEDGERSSIDWNMAYPIILMEHYKRHGDLSLLRHHYEPLKAHTAYYIGLRKDGLIPYCWFGDWLTSDYPEGDVGMVAFKAGPDNHRQNPPYAATLFFCTTLRHLIDVATLLGEHEEAAYYTAIREESVKVLQDNYYHAETGVFGGGGQFLQAYALHESIVPTEDREKVFAGLVAVLEEKEYHLICGIIGTRVIFDVLDAFDRRDLIYRILDTKGYLTPQNLLSDGRTTLPEWPNGIGSGCHCMWGSPGSVFYKVFAGVTVDRLRKVPISIRPYFEKGLGFVNCTQQLPEGELLMAWKYEGEKVSVKLTLPVEAYVELSGIHEKGCGEIWKTGTYEMTV